MKTFVAYTLAVYALACAVVTVVSLATTFWVTSAVDGVVSGHSGLFQYCSYSGCVSFPLTTDSGNAVQAFMIIALLVLVATTICCVLVAMKKAPPQSIPALFAGAAVSAVIAMAVFTGKVHLSENTSFGYSFILGWFAFGLDLALVPVSAVLAKASEYSVIP